MFPIQPDESSSSAEEAQPTQEEETPIVTTPITAEEATLPSVEGQAKTPSSAEAALPPEAQGETHGGPLGCCLGTVVGLFLTVTLLLGLSLLLSNGGTLGVATIPVIMLGAIVCGYFGWQIGKRVYKEYEQPVVKRQYRSTPAKKKKKKNCTRIE